MTNQLPSPAQPTGPAHDSSRTFGMRFTSTPRGARLARRLAAHRLDTWGIPYGTGPHEEIVLVLGELTANAVRHGQVPGRDFHLLLRVCAPTRTARIEVTDTRSERTPPDPVELHAPGAEDTGGRGLLLVAGLASHWGWYLRPDGPGKTVWAECAYGAECSPGGDSLIGLVGRRRLPG
ncbi:ATP-binding protein [Streptomyces pilosus]|uniref:ATP-binding protein n=1 Tax=Streptomyces pilosus TaxID=28893 RepID=UPI0036FF6A67